jgi:hypothetical protein
MKSRYAKQWVNLQLHGEPGYLRCYIKNVGFEAGVPVYLARYEDGTTETIFVDSVFRIWSANPKKARVVDLDKRRKKRLRLVR